MINIKKSRIKWFFLIPSLNDAPGVVLTLHMIFLFIRIWRRVYVHILLFWLILWREFPKVVLKLFGHLFGIWVFTRCFIWLHQSKTATVCLSRGYLVFMLNIVVWGSAVMGFDWGKWLRDASLGRLGRFTHFYDCFRGDTLIAIATVMGSLFCYDIFQFKPKLERLNNWFFPNHVDPLPMVPHFYIILNDIVGEDIRIWAGWNIIDLFYSWSLQSYFLLISPHSIDCNISLIPQFFHCRLFIRRSFITEVNFAWRTVLIAWFLHLFLSVDHYHWSRRGCILINCHVLALFGWRPRN